MKQKKQCRYCGSYSTDSLRRCCNAGHVEDRDLAEVEAAGRRAAQRTQVGEHLKGTRRAAHDGVVILRASVELRSARQNGHCRSDYAAVFARVVTACEKAAEKALVDAMAKEHRAAKDAGIAVFIAKPVVEQDVKYKAQKAPIANGGTYGSCMRCGTKDVLRSVHWGQHDCTAAVCVVCMGKLGGDWAGLTFPWAYCEACGHPRREQSAEVPKAFTTGMFHPSCRLRHDPLNTRALGLGLGKTVEVYVYAKMCKACGGSREVQDSTPVAYDDGVYHPWCRKQKMAREHKQGWSE
jgi:hypothetical protein